MQVLRISSTSLFLRNARHVAIAIALLATPRLLRADRPHFLQAPALVSGIGGSEVASADVNGDGHADLVFTRNPVTIVPGRGDGTFGDPITVDGTQRVTRVVVADLNRDSRPDLLVGDDLGAITVYLANANGTFTAGTQYWPDDLRPPYAFPVSSIAAGDFNGDGKCDFVASSASATSVFFGSGDGSFGEPTKISYGETVIAADFNNDGRDDVGMLSQGGSIAVALSENGRTFRVTTPVGHFIRSFAAGDINSDGIADVVATAYPDSLLLFSGVGDGTFRPDVSIAKSGVPLGGGIGIADINADGRQDLVATGLSTVTVFVGRGDGTFLDRRSFGPDSGTASSAIADFDENGTLDIATTVSFLSGNGDGTFAAAPAVPFSVDHPTAFAVADFNGDNVPDLVVATYDTVTTITRNANGSYRRKEYELPCQPGAFAVADLNGDRHDDVVVPCTAGSRGDGELDVFLADSDGVLGEPTRIPTGRYPHRIAAADFNRDGRVDIVTQHSVDGTPNLAILLGNGDGTLSSIRNFPSPDSWDVAAVDVDKDGSIDLVLPVQQQGIYVAKGYGDGTFAAPARASFSGGAYPVVGDFNSDGNADLVFGDSREVVMLPGDGAGRFGEPSYYGVVAGGPAIAAGRFDDDPQLDLVLASEYDNKMSIVLGNADGSFGGSTVFSLPQTATNVLTADFDRDGRTDIALAEGDDVRILLNDTVSAPEAHDFPAFDGFVTDITAGPDGAMWFTDSIRNVIGRITITGSVTEFHIVFDRRPERIVAGQDGALWFCEQDDLVGKITPSGVLKEFLIPSRHRATEMAAAADAVWFTEPEANRIGRITSEGTITEFPTGEWQPNDIALGPDGAIWFIASSGSSARLCRISSAGDITTLALPDSATRAGILTGPDGAFWLTGTTTYRVTTSGEITTFDFPLPQKGAVGPDGAMWFGTYQLLRLTTAGELTMFPLESANFSVNSIASGPDGAVWFTEMIGGATFRSRIGRMPTHSRRHLTRR